MAACSFCFATVAEGDATCPRCGRAVGAAARIDDRPTLTSWTAAPAPAAPPTPSAPVADPPPAGPPAWTAPSAPEPSPVAPWRPPDASGSIPPSSAPPASAPVAPPAAWAPPPAGPAAAWPPPPPSAPAAWPPAAGPGGWPAAGVPPWPDAAAPPAGADPDLDRANVLVLVVVSTIVALGIIVLAVLATNAIGPDPDGVAPVRSASVEARATAEVAGGR